MRVDAFDFNLPPERIALTPAYPRDSARMLVVGADGGLTDSYVRDLPDFLTPGDALVVNDTKVIAARLEGVRVRGDAVASIEATLIERVDDCRWRALARPAKKLKVGERIRFGEASESMACLLAALDAEIEDKGEAGEALLRFDFAGAALDEAIERLGVPPLPPYIASRRAVTESDRTDYQTMFAAKPGAVAAPTAGLHFTPALVARLTRAASRCIASLCMSAPGLSRPSKSMIRATTRCNPSGARSTLRLLKRSMPFENGEAGSSAWARPRRASSRAPLTRMVEFNRFRAKPTFLSVPDTASASSTRS